MFYGQDSEPEPQPSKLDLHDLLPNYKLAVLWIRALSDRTFWAVPDPDDLFDPHLQQNFCTCGPYLRMYRYRVLRSHCLKGKLREMVLSLFSPYWYKRIERIYPFDLLFNRDRVS
jgi:hypothetical protein